MIDWKKVDRSLWESKSDVELSTILGVSKAMVNTQRFLFAPDTTKRARLDALWSSLDWSKSTEELIAATGCSKGSIITARRRYAPAQHKAKPYVRFDPAGIDWSRGSTDIAREKGVSTVCVSVARKKYAPETVRAIRRKGDCVLSEPKNEK